jgi:hypothetical protein
VTFNIFSHYCKQAELTKTLKGISKDVAVKIWADEDISGMPLGRPYDVFFIPNIRLTWVQKFRLAAAEAANRRDKWFGYAHDDGEISPKDFSRLITKAAKAASNAFMVLTPTPARDDCADVYALLRTAYYWDIGGHDQLFDFYWADIDFYVRQKKLGRVQIESVSQSIQHGRSSVIRRAKSVHSVAMHATFKKDETVFKAKHPLYVHT